MNRDFPTMKANAESEFLHDTDNGKLKRRLANRGIELAKEWYETSFGSVDESVDDKKARCSAFIKEKLMSEKENYGFVGTLVGAVLFSLIVQLIVRWIMKKFFDE